MEQETGTRSQFSELLRYSRPMLTAAGVFTLIIMVVGVIGNLLTVAALWRNSKLRTYAAAFISSLCISDLMFCFLVLPFAASQFFHGYWIHGPILCTMIPVLRYGSVCISLLSIAMISINRYILIAWPNLYATIYTKTTVTICIFIIWLFSYGIQLPTILGVWGAYGFDQKLGTCSILKDSNGHSPKIVFFVVGFAVPCIIIVASYAKIYWVVRSSHQRLKQHSCSTADYKRSEMKITKMVLVIFLCFVVCYLPITLVKVVDEEVNNAPVHIIGYLLIYMSACVNPVVYVTMNKQYRQAYLDTLLCRYSSNLSSQHNTQSPHHKNSHLSVGYLKNMVTVSSSPKAQP